MLQSFVSTIPVSNRPPLLSPPCLTTVSKECCCKPLHPRPLRTPVFRRLATLPLSSPSTHLENIRGVCPVTTINHTPPPHALLSPRPRALKSHEIAPRQDKIAAWQDHVGAQHCCAPACPGVNPATIRFFPRITFHFLSLLLLSHVVDSAIIRGAH